MNRIRSNPSRSSAWLVLAVLLGALMLAFVSLRAWDVYSLGFVTLAAMVASSRVAARWWSLPRPGVQVRRARRVLLVGSGMTAQLVAGYVELEGGQVVGCVEDAERLGGVEPPASLVGSRAELAQLARELEVDRIIVTEAPAEAWDLLARLEDTECEVDIVPGPYELALCPPSSLRVGDVALYRLPRRATRRAFRAAKRAFDCTVSAVLLAVFAPLLVLSAVAIRLTSPGPALFRQERVGRNGRRFDLVKLRTMVVDAEKDGPQLCAGKSDPRLTPVGRLLRRTHLDELPQLLNVLRGEMSLVGPRPERPEFVERFEQEVPGYAERHRVVPGITGLAQVYGTYHSSPREKLRFDLMYLHHGSLLLDLRVMLRTLGSMFG